MSELELHIQNTKTLINFFKNDWDELSQKLHTAAEEGSFCQCGSEKFILTSSNPTQMRSFLLISIFFDQFFHQYYQLIYEEFEKEFNFPKLFSHSGAGHHPPSWFIYKKHGYHKKVDWDNVRDIAIIITEDILKWFTRFNDKEDIPYLKKSIEKEVNNTFIEYPDAVLLNHIFDKHIH